MLRDRGLRQWQFVNDVAAHPRFFLGEHPKDSDSRWMGNRLGKRGQFVVGRRSLDRSCEQLNALPLRCAARSVVRAASRTGISNFRHR